MSRKKDEEMESEETMPVDGSSRFIRIAFKSSSTLAYANYDRLLMRLLLTFQTGCQYCYYGVDEETVLNLESVENKGESVGKFFHLYLRKFRCERTK